MYRIESASAIVRLHNTTTPKPLKNNQNKLATQQTPLRTQIDKKNIPRTKAYQQTPPKTPSPHTIPTTPTKVSHKQGETQQQQHTHQKYPRTNIGIHPEVGSSSRCAWWTRVSIQFQYSKCFIRFRFRPWETTNFLDLYLYFRRLIGIHNVTGFALPSVCLLQLSRFFFLSLSLTLSHSYAHSLSVSLFFYKYATFTPSRCPLAAQCAVGRRVTYSARKTSYGLGRRSNRKIECF